MGATGLRAKCIVCGKKTYKNWLVQVGMAHNNLPVYACDQSFTLSCKTKFYRELDTTAGVSKFRTRTLAGICPNE
nr:hypothetical protein [uncultured Draconibacterium sp.]